MQLKSLILPFFLSIMMLGLMVNVTAQRRPKQKKLKNPVEYKNTIRGYGRFEPYAYAGATINAGNYFGDLAPVSKKASTDISFTRPGFGVYGGYRFQHSLAVRVGINWVRIYGDDFSAGLDPENIPRYARNLSFRNDIKEFQFGIEVFLLPNYGGPNQRLPINAYLFLGGAVYHHEPRGKVPKADYQQDQSGAIAAPNASKWVKLRPLGTEGQNMGIVKPYKSIQFAIPVSVGLQMRVPNSQLNAGIEFGIRYLFTDYIDDVSSNYVDLKTLEDSDGPLARILADRSSEPTSVRGEVRTDLDRLTIIQGASPNHNFYTSGFIGSGIEGVTRGNPDNNDLIFVSQIKVTYILGSLSGRTRKYK